MGNNVVIIGGGITGAFIGYYLAKQEVAVSIIDPESEDSRASSNNPAGINPLHGPDIPGIMSEFAMFSYPSHTNEWNNIYKHSKN